MATRGYGQYCGLARALELVGERWALLLVRDLLVGPRRFTDLRRGLPRIPTNILSTRLRELERAGVIHRRALPRPEGGVVYELTEYGHELEDAVIALGRWGARSLGEPAADEIITPAAIVMAVRSSFQPYAARGLHVDYEIRLGEVVVGVRVRDGELAAQPGPQPDADLVIETGPAIRGLLTGEISAAEAVQRGLVRLTGDPALLATFVELFRIPTAPRVRAA